MNERSSRLNLLRNITTLLSLGIFIGCNGSTDIDDSQPSLLETRFQNLTANKLDTIRTPDTVVVKRIESTLEGEESLTEFQPLEGEQLKALQTLLLNVENYGWDYAKPCEPAPGILIRFSTGSDHLDVRLCFECIMIGFSPGEWNDFDPIESEMISWAKTVFPDDEVIKSLAIQPRGGNAR